MIIPIGHEESEVRRLPWVTIAIVVLCLLTFLATDIPSARDSWLDDAALDEATNYWLQHAYLEPRYEILDEVTYQVPEEQEEAFVAGLRQGNPGPDDPEIVASEQAELDRLSEQALQLHIDGSAENDFTRWGLVPTSPSALGLITHMFMHAGWLHLLSNMFLFFLAAPAIEDRWGRPLFGGFYLLAGIAGGFVYTLMSSTSSIPLIGASGAIAGVLGAFLVRYWSTKIKFAYFFFLGLRWMRGTFEAPAFLMLPLWFANELLQAWLWGRVGLSDGIAYWAHVGGFLFGVSGALLVSRLKIEERFIHSAIESKVTLLEGNPVIELAMTARENGDPEGAFAMLRDECQSSPEDADIALAFFDTAVSLRRPDAASKPMLGAIRRFTARGDLELATRYWVDLADVLPTAFADPNTLIRILPTIKEMDSQKHVQLALRQAVDPRNHGLTAGMALRIIEQARELDPPSALQAAKSALRFEDIHETKRARLEELIANLEANGVELAPIEEPESEPIAAAGGREMSAEWADEASIPLAGEDGPGAVVGDALAIAAAPAAQPQPRALSAEGSLIQTDENASSLGMDPQEELGFDPSAQLDAIPESDFGLEPGAELGAEIALPEEEPVDETIFAAPEDGVLGLDPSEQIPAVATPVGLAQNEAPATPPPLPPMGAETPPPLPTATVAPPPLPDAAPPIGATPEPIEAVQNLDLGDLIADEELRALIEIPRFSGVKVVEAAPKEFTDRGIVLTVNGGRKARVEYDKVQALAVAAVGGLAKNPVVVIDLVLNWNDDAEGPVRVVRLRSDGFDPRSLVSAGSQLQAFRAFLAELLERSGATPLPSRDAVLAKSLCRQPDLATYEREILEAAA